VGPKRQSRDEGFQGALVVLSLGKSLFFLLRIEDIDNSTSMFSNPPGMGCDENRKLDGNQQQ
jgi:hypothetical protein